MATDRDKMLELALAQIEKDSDRNLWLSADESIKYGLADRILQKAPEIVKNEQEQGQQ